jgi:hypothetical protein
VEKGAKVPSIDALFEKREFLKDKIVCPSGGKYIVPAYGEDPTCTVHKSVKDLRNQFGARLPRSPVEGIKRAPSDKLQCEMNLRRLGRAIDQWAKDKNLKPGDEGPKIEELCGEGKILRRTPKCPSGGTYKIGKIGELPQCSIHGKYEASQRQIMAPGMKRGTAEPTL